MQILSEVPGPLKGRGHNSCVPIKCDCATEFLFPLSDGVIEDRDHDNETIAVKCPGCANTKELASIDLLAAERNGQAK